MLQFSKSKLQVWKTFSTDTKEENLASAKQQWLQLKDPEILMTEPTALRGYLYFSMAFEIQLGLYFC